jgi:type II secretory pathway pseudopilin PulG
LVESIVATGLIATIVLFTMGLIPSFKLSNRRAGAELQAGSIAQSHLPAGS